MDRVEPEAWTEMGGIGAEAVIGIGAEHDQPLDEEKEREPRCPDHEWDAGDLDRLLDLVLLVLDVLAVARAPCRHHLPLLASRRRFASEHTPCRMVLSSATGRWCSRARRNWRQRSCNCSPIGWRNTVSRGSAICCPSCGGADRRPKGSTSMAGSDGARSCCSICSSSPFTTHRSAASTFRSSWS